MCGSFLFKFFYLGSYLACLLDGPKDPCRFPSGSRNRRLCGECDESLLQGTLHTVRPHLSSRSWGAASTAV